MSAILHYYRRTEPPHSLLPSVKEELKNLGLDADAAKIRVIDTESCFNVKTETELDAVQTQRLEWLLAETFERDALRLERSFFDAETTAADAWTVEFGPRMTFTSAFSSNAVSICTKCDLPISRLELSWRYRFCMAEDGQRLSAPAVTVIKAMLHDRMTQEEYPTPLATFQTGLQPKPLRTIPIMKEGRAALEKLNDEMGLGFDDFDLDYYTHLFKVSKHRNATIYPMQIFSNIDLVLVSVGETWSRSH